ncbi:MAG: hypothetical protein PHW63_03440 [Alphaproteobacteria bacterium]|nr:hypothetical protein [Alphaproteobacteria bacterium]
MTSAKNSHNKDCPPASIKVTTVEPTRPGSVVPTGFCAHPSGYMGEGGRAGFEMDYAKLAAVSGAKTVPASQFISGFKPRALVCV